MTGGELARQITAAALGPPLGGPPPSGAFIKSLKNVWLRRYRLEESFIAFQGHFDSRPVLPALAQVLMAKDCVEAVSGQKTIIEAVEQGKFLSLVPPGVILSVYGQSPDGDNFGSWRFHLTFSDRDQEEQDASFIRLKIGPKGERP